MPYLGNPLSTAFSSRIKQDFASPSGTSFTMNQKVSDANDISLYINHVRQEPGIAYTVDGTTTLTTTGTLTSADDMYIIYDELTIQTAEHPEGQALRCSTLNASGASTLTGAVGIGVASPDALLHIASSGGFQNIERFAGADAAGPGINFRKSRGSSQNSTTIVAANDVLGQLYFQGATGSSFESGAMMRAAVDGTPGSGDLPSRLEFHTAPDGSATVSERMRITSLGYTKMSYDVQNTASGSLAMHELLGNENSYVFRSRNFTTNGNTFIALFRHTSAPDDNTSTFLYCDDGNGADARLRIDSDGDVKNHDNSYGAISDERIKQDITNANSQWNDIKSIKIRNFKKKDDVRKYGNKAWSQIGVIAQELETVSPKLIRENSVSVGDIVSSSEFGTLEDDLENPVYYVDGDTIPSGKKVGDIKEYMKKVKEQKTTVKSVNYSILYMKAVKALQEAMARIETLEAKVKALEEA